MKKNGADAWSVPFFIISLQKKYKFKYLITELQKVINNIAISRI